MSESTSARPVSVTFKYGKGYEEPWVVFQGTAAEVRAEIASFFGVTEEVHKDFTLSELVVFANNVAHGKGAAAAILGATPVPSSMTGQSAFDIVDAEAGGQQKAGDEPARQAQSEQDAEVGALLGKIAEATSRDALKDIWARNRALFDAKPELTEAYKAKGKSLPA